MEDGFFPQSGNIERSGDPKVLLDYDICYQIQTLFQSGKNKYMHSIGFNYSSMCNFLSVYSYIMQISPVFMAFIKMILIVL